jgi:outer membrane protein OmpA-like peptidoglycan-associated protein
MRLQAAVRTASGMPAISTLAGATYAGVTTPGFNARARAGTLTPLVMLLALVGCSQPDWSKMNPETWWHNMEGGAIAQSRPPAPGANQPYPNLASVPARPPDPDRPALQDITDGLVADRTNAQHVAATAPLADPSTPGSAPGLFGVGSAPPPGSGSPISPTQPGVTPGAGAPAAASATLPAASAPPTPATPPAKAPVKEVQSGALPPLTPPPAHAPEPNMPQVPPNPPAPASVAGIPTPPSPALPKPPALGPQSVEAKSSAPTPEASASANPSKGPLVSATPPAVQVAAATPPPSRAATPIHRPEPAAASAPIGAAALNGAEPVSSGNTVAVAFATGSSDVPPSASGPLRALAGRRGNALITVTGYGDATDASPDAQAAALKLALARAQAIAHALIAAGAPTSAVQVDAQAIGRGGTARLLP